MSGAYYNDSDAYVCDWLENLIGAGHIAPGDVDRRSIADVRPDDIRGYTQCHFFAGIGGWSYALRLAGWPDDRPVWTGSCPCQPFSAAGAGKAADDERHLWPRWFPLIAERRPAVIFGEQVDDAIGWGWTDLVFANLEACGYACGQTILPACCVGPPHIRDRIWFVAHADGGDASTKGLQPSGEHRQQPEDCGACRGTGWVLPSFGANFTVPCEQCLASGRVAHTTGRGSGSGLRNRRPATQRQPVAANGGGMVNATGEQARLPGCARKPGTPDYSQAEWIECADGKLRPIEPGSFPLAHGIPARASKLRAYGNAIVPQVAAEFIAAYLDLERSAA